MTLDEFAGMLQKAKRGTWKGMPRYKACCPAHEDSEPSFVVWEGTDGWLHVMCQKGCSEDSIIGAMGLSQEDRRTLPPLYTNGKPVQVDYKYTDTDGSYLFTKRRIPNGADKRFLQLIEQNGTELFKLDSLGPKSKTLYRSPEVAAAVKSGTTVYVCEGEKGAESLRRAGAVATCQPAGAGPGKWLPSHTAALKGANVVIVADRDADGEAYAKEVAAALKGSAASCTVVQSMTTRPKDDAWDHLAAGHSLDEFVRRKDLEPSRGLERRQFDVSFVPVVASFIVRPYFPKGKAVLLDADGGTGKSSFAVASAAWFTRGLSFVGKYELGRPARVLYCHKKEDQSDELHTVFTANGGVPELITYQEGGFALDRSGIESLEETIVDDRIDVVYFDALFYFLSGIKDNKLLLGNAFDVSAVLEPLMQMYARRDVLGVHIRHTHQMKPGEDASAMGMGTVQFRNSHRGQLVMRWHPDKKTYPGVVVVTDEKGSILVEKGDPFYFRRCGLEIQPINNMPEGNPFQRDPSSKRGPDPKKTTEIAKWLHTRLKDGPRPIFEILTFAKVEDYKTGSVYNARDMLGLSESHDEKGRKTWELDPYADLPWDEE